MGKIAFVFAGQGAQYPGMGQELAQCSPAAAEIFAKLDALRPGTSAQCFGGTDEELKETKNTQPCMFAVERPAAAALEEGGLRADMAAGFSLGEIGALTYTRAVDLETGFHLVCRRGELMQAAAEEQPTAMAAVLKLSNEEVEADLRPICAGLSGQLQLSRTGLRGLRQGAAGPFSAGEGGRGTGSAAEGAGGLSLALHGHGSPGLCPGAGGMPGGTAGDAPVFQPDGGGLRRGPQTFAVPADCLPGSVGDHRAEYDCRRGGHLCGAGAGQDPVRPH
ncbi:MAG: ACP S-malonyltransferase [Evtepia gabavorous]